MFRFAVILCVFGVFAGSADCQASRIEPLRISAGTILTFHLQNRLRTAADDAMGNLPEGTVFKVKMLDSIDTSVNHDGSAFRGSIVGPVVYQNLVVVQSEAGVQGLLALLRSKSHPEGFRYELLVTGITQGGKSYALTASLSPSLFDDGPRQASLTSSAMKEDSVARSAVASKLP
jgi:hypothetical protein